MRLLKLFLAIIAVSSQQARPAEVTSITTNEIARFVAPEARQAVAVDDQCFYAISNQTIAKYDKRTGAAIVRWQASDELPLRHLNSGVVINGEIHCAHSNFPDFPETSSVEVWDVETLEHSRTHSFGIYEGSLTWIDWHDNAWWGVFAHYSKEVNGNPHAKKTCWTSLVKFDSEWRRLAGWVFPEKVTRSFEPHSCSGGTWSPNGRLYCTGHDRGELYVLDLPRAGSVLRLHGVLEVPFTGQGIAWDNLSKGVIYGINRTKGEVVAVQVDGELSPELAQE